MDALYICAKLLATLSLPVKLTDFSEILRSYSYWCRRHYGPRLTNANNRPSFKNVQRVTANNSLALQSAVPKCCIIQLIYPSLHVKLLFSMHCKLVDIDNHMVTSSFPM